MNASWQIWYGNLHQLAQFSSQDCTFLASRNLEKSLTMQKILEDEFVGIIMKRQPCVVRLCVGQIKESEKVEHIIVHRANSGSVAPWDGYFYLFRLFRGCSVAPWGSLFRLFRFSVCSVPVPWLFRDSLGFIVPFIPFVCLFCGCSVAPWVSLFRLFRLFRGSLGFILPLVPFVLFVPRLLGVGCSLFRLLSLFRAEIWRTGLPSPWTWQHRWRRRRRLPSTGWRWQSSMIGSERHVQPLGQGDGDVSFGWGCVVATDKAVLIAPTCTSSFVHLFSVDGTELLVWEQNTCMFPSSIDWSPNFIY